MRNQLLTQPVELKEFIKTSGSIDDIDEEHLTAIAEAYLRLAIHPSTEPVEALSYLKKGYRIDNVDPRFAYHIARIYFKIKEFNQARKWLMIAFGHCPTSHRIWVHIALLQNELNLEYNKQNQYRKDDLKEKALIINEHIIDKSDSIDISLLQFEPSKSDKQPDSHRVQTKLSHEKGSLDSEDLSKDAIQDFILNVLKIHAELLETSFRSVNPEDQLNNIDHAVRELAEYGTKINWHIETKLGSFCRLTENEFDMKYILPKYKLFYFYLDALLRINIFRRKIIFKSGLFLNSVQFEKDTDFGKNHPALITLKEKVSNLEITTGKKKMEELEQEIDRSINKIKSTRKIDKNKCRWLGVFDISIENYLFNEASTLFLDKITPLLEEVVKLIDKRPNGRSALAVLCTEWLISGYSPQGIRRITDGLEHNLNDELISFINLLCDLFECEIEELPELLASHLRNKNITPLLATLILKRRYLWREIDYEKTFEFKKSLQILNNWRKNKESIPDITEVNQYLNSLLDGLSGMWNPRKTPYSVIDSKNEANKIKTYNYQETSLIINELTNGIQRFHALTEKLQYKFLKDFKHKYTSISNSSDYAYVLKHYEELQKLGNIYSGFVRQAFELKGNAMSGLQKDIDDKLKGTLSEKEAALTSELQGLKCCPQILKNIEKNLTKNSSLNDKTEYPDGVEKILTLVHEEAKQISSSVYSKLTESDDKSDNNDIFLHLSFFNKLIGEIHRLIEELQVTFLKDFNVRCKKIETQEEFSYVLSNLDCLKSINSTINRMTRASQSAMEILFEEMKDTEDDKKKDIVAGKDKIDNSLKEIENMCPKTGKYDSRILSLGNKFEKTGSDPDKTLVELTGRAEKIYNDFILNSENAELFKDSKETPKSGNLFFDKIGLIKSEKLADYKSTYSGIEGLENVVLIVDQEIEDILNYSLDSFGFFDESHIKNPFVVDLQAHLLNQAAETYFRFGLYKKAIKYWRHIILLKEIDATASKNIAIAETMIDQNDENILHAWRKHCEDLYRCDIITGNPVEHAREREEIHAKLSSVYAPFLIRSKEIRQRDEEEYKVKLQQFIALINNPAQFYEFVIHKIAELFNNRLGFKSPVLFLGLPINADEIAIRRASATMVNFIDSTCAALPEKIKGPFLDLCLEYLTKCKVFCLDRNNMSLAKNPSYEEDKKKLQAWIKTVLELKETIFLYIKDSEGMMDDLKYIDIVFILDLLNRLPVEIDKGILDDMASSTFVMYKNTNLSELPEIFANNMIQIPLQSFLKILTANESPSGQRFYKQISRILTDGDSYHVDRNAEYMRFIDSPMNFLPDFVKEYISIKEKKLESEQSKQVIKYLTDKCKQYPFITGFPRLLSNIDFRTGKPFLKDALKNAFNMKIELECIRELEIGELHYELNSLKKLYNEQKYKDAYIIITSILESHKNKITVLENSINEMQIIPPRLKNDLLLLTGRYYYDKEEISKSMHGYLNISDEELINKVTDQAVNADISFLSNHLLNSIGGWIKSDPDDVKTHIGEFHKYLCLFEENLTKEPEEEQKEWIENMNHLLINASIGYLGKVDSQEKLIQAVSAMKNLLKLDEENNYALYYLALFNQNMAALIAKQSGIDSAKEYFRTAYSIAAQLKEKYIGPDENFKGQINQLHESLEENKEIFLN